MSILVLKHDQLCNLNRELFHSVPAFMNTSQPVSHPWMNMTVLLKNLKFYAHFYLFFWLIPFFYLVGGGDASHKMRMYNDEGKNKLLLCIIM